MDDHTELFTVLKELHNISGFRISIHDKDFREIAGYPKKLSCFCGLIQQNKEAKQICVQNDLSNFKLVQKERQVRIYQCRFGLYEAVAPLFTFGELTGYLMMGQLLDTFDVSRDFVYLSALPYVEDKSALKRAIESIPVNSKGMILSCITIMDICAKYITLSHRIHVPQKDLTLEIKKYINLNYNKKIAVEQLCRQFLCSRSTLMNSFKKSGLTINQYITEVRMEKAAEMLSQSGRSIKNIAADCGFEDQNYFSKVFRKFYRTSPSVYRNHTEKRIFENTNEEKAGVRKEKT